MNPGPSGLYVDIETSLILCGVYALHDQNHINPEHVLQDWFMICASWQWVDGKRIYSTAITDDEKRFRKDPTDDYHVVKELYDAIAQADYLVGHNIKGFDWKKFMARVIVHRLPPLPQPMFVDTLSEARKYGFTSRKLGALAKRLDLRHKLDMEGGLPMGVIRGEASAVAKYVAYNRGDIPPLEDLYLRLRPYMQRHPNHNLWRGDGIICCPKCGGTHVQARGYKRTAAGKYAQMKCLTCGGWFSSGKSVKRVEMR